MHKEKDGVYRALQETLDKLPVGFPATESGVEIRILKRLFSPEKALIASKLESFPKAIDKIFDELEKEGIPYAKVEKALVDMFEEGLIAQVIKDIGAKKIKNYAASAFMLGFYEFQINKMTEQFINDVDQYFEEGFTAELNKTKIPQLRTIPIEKEIGIDRDVANYDDFRHFLDNCGEPIVVNECICRKKNDIIGKSCEKTDLRESCFSFRSIGMANIDRGIGRIITKEEALEILEQAEREGLVLQAGNSQRPASLCTCCGCCCNLLYNEKKFDAPAQFFGSNYYAQVDQELCTGCGVCETRCQMDAVDIVDNISNINLDRCIGCGVCVTTCLTDSLHLVRKPESEQKDVPRTFRDTMVHLLKVRGKLKPSWVANTVLKSKIDRIISR